MASLMLVPIVYKCARAVFVDALAARHLAPVFVLVGTTSLAMFLVYPSRAVKFPASEIKEFYA